MEIPIVVETNEVNVAGFTTSLELQTDIGARGKRGSIIFSGSALPTTSPSTTPVNAAYGMVSAFQTGDLYIKLGQPYHGYLYIYQDQPGGAEWIPIFPIQESLYYNTKELDFTNGESEICSIPLVDILGSSSAPSVTNFKILATVQKNSTNVYTTSIKSVGINGVNLEVVFNSRTISNDSTPVTTRTTETNLPVNISIGVIP